MNWSLSVGKYDVIHTGSVLVPENHDSVAMTFNDVKFVFKLVNNDKDERTLDFISETNKSLEIKATNFRDSDGTATLNFTEVGEVSGQKLFLTFSVHGIGGGFSPVRLLSFTFARLSQP